MGATTKTHGTRTDLTITLNSLANGGWRESDAIIDLTAETMKLYFTIATTTTAGSASGTVDVYMAESLDGGTDYSGGAAGTGDAAFTPSQNNGKELTHLKSLPCDASETTARTYEYCITVHDLPEDAVIVVENNTGAALASSGNSVEYRTSGWTTA